MASMPDDSRMAERDARIARLAWGGSSAGRASRSQCEGRGFDPLPLHQLPPVFPPFLPCGAVPLEPRRAPIVPLAEPPQPHEKRAASSRCLGGLGGSVTTLNSRMTYEREPRAWLS